MPAPQPESVPSEPEQNDPPPVGAEASQKLEQMWPSRPSQPASPPPPQTPAANPEWPLYQPPLLAATPDNSFGSGIEKRKKMFIFGGVCAFILLSTLGFIFGYYLPNKPENVWKTGLSRTGKALDSLVADATTTEKIDLYTSGDLYGTFEYNFEDNKNGGTFFAKYGDSVLNVGFNATIGSSEPAEEVSLDIRGATEDGKQVPTIYAKAKGLDGLGLGAFYPGLDAMINDKWIVADAEYLEGIGSSAASLVGDFSSTGPDTGGDEDVTDEQEPELTKEDVAEVSQVASKVTRDYVFNPSPDKSILNNDGFVGKEEVDGIKAYHYKVSISKENSTKYCQAFYSAIAETRAYKKFESGDGASEAEICVSPDDEEDIEFDEELEDTSEGAGSEDSSELPAETELNNDGMEMDLWIDAKTKLIYKLRLSDPEAKDNYVDIGQRYSGGDNVVLFIAGNEQETKQRGKIETTFNIKNGTSSTIAEYASEDPGSSGSIKVTLESKPLSEDFSIEVPEGAIPLQDVLESIGVSGESLIAPTDF